MAVGETLADSDGARHRRGGQDRHARRHRSARAHAASVHDARWHDALHAGPDRVGMAALWGGTTTLIDFAYATADRSVREGHRGARRAVRAQELLRLGLPPDAQQRSAAHAVWRAGGGHPGRLPHHQDLHHQHLAAPHRPHGRLRRHLGGLQGARQGRRARRHPRRGQRHRHAHVRQADPRGARRLRESWPRCTTRCRRT